MSAAKVIQMTPATHTISVSKLSSGGGVAEARNEEIVGITYHGKEISRLRQGTPDELKQTRRNVSTSNLYASPRKHMQKKGLVRVTTRDRGDLVLEVLVPQTLQKKSKVKVKPRKKAASKTQRSPRRSSTKPVQTLSQQALLARLESSVGPGEFHSFLQHLSQAVNAAGVDAINGFHREATEKPAFARIFESS